MRPNIWNHDWQFATEQPLYSGFPRVRWTLQGLVHCGLTRHAPCAPSLQAVPQDPEERFPQTLLGWCKCLLASDTVATSHMWLLSTWNVVTVNQELKFSFCFILINLYLNSYLWLVAVLLDSTGLECNKSLPFTVEKRGQSYIFLVPLLKTPNSLCFKVIYAH